MTPSVNVDLVMSWVEDNPEVISVTVKVDYKETENGSVDSLLESLMIASDVVSDSVLMATISLVRVDGVVSDSVVVYAAFPFVVTSPWQTGKLDAGMVVRFVLCWNMKVLILILELLLKCDNCWVSFQISM